MGCGGVEMITIQNDADGITIYFDCGGWICIALSTEHEDAIVYTLEALVDDRFRNILDADGLKLFQETFVNAQVLFDVSAQHLLEGLVNLYYHFVVDPHDRHMMDTALLALVKRRR